MATQVLTDCTIFVNEYDLSADVNSVEHDWEAAEVDATTFGSGGDQELKAGIAKSKVNFGTFYNTADGQSEPVLTSLKGVSGSVLTLSPNGTDGDRAIFCKGLSGGVKLLGKVGDMANVGGSFMTSDPAGLVEGYLIAEKQTASANTSGTVVEYGAVSSTQTVYASLHVFSVSGTDTPTVVAYLQSDDGSGFGSASNVITFTSATAPGAQFKSATGPVTDTFWRARFEMSGTDPSFVIAMAFAIV